MSANSGTLDLPVRRANWKAVTLGILSGIVLGAGALVITRTVHHGSGSVTKEAPATGIQAGGMENPSLYVPPQEAASTGGMENPSLYVPPQEAAATGGMENPSLYVPPQEGASTGGMENPSLYVPRAVFHPADPYTCRPGKVRPC